MTDDGADGYMLGGDEQVIDNIIKPMILGENPREREKLWNWMDQKVTFDHSLRYKRAGICIDDRCCQYLQQPT